MATLSDDQLLRIATRHKAGGSFIQGFRYGLFHVIRDLRKPLNEQVIWQKQVSASNEEFQNQLEIERMRFAMEKDG